MAASRALLCALILITLPFMLSSSGVDSPGSKYTNLIVIEGTGPETAASNVPQRGVAAEIIDYNADGNADTFVSSHLIDIVRNGQSLSDVGAGNVIFGGNSGPSRKKNEQLFMIDFGVEPQPGDSFGISSASGDVNGDRISDIAVGANGFDAEFGSNSGAVFVYLGKPGGKPDPAQILPGDQANALLGTDVASGDFNGDDFLDIAASEPGATVNRRINAGKVRIYDGSPSGLSFRGEFHLGTRGIKGKPTTNAFFGRRLFSLNINNDRFDDLLINTVESNLTGSVNVLYGGPGGLSATGNQRITLKTNKPNGLGFRFGFCYCNDDDFADAILTTPDLDNNTGGAFVLNGTARGLTTTGSSFLRGPFSLPGNEFGFSVATGGTRGNFLLGIGSPFADVRIGNRLLQDGGAVDYFRAKSGQAIEFLLRDLGGKLKTGRNDGDRYRTMLGAGMDRDRLFFFTGAPGAKVGGKNNAGAVLSFRVDDFQNKLELGLFKNFNRNNLKGSTSPDDFFGRSVTNSRLFGNTGP